MKIKGDIVQQILDSLPSEVSDEFRAYVREILKAYSKVIACHQTLHHAQSGLIHLAAEYNARREELLTKYPVDPVGQPGIPPQVYVWHGRLPTLLYFGDVEVEVQL